MLWRAEDFALYPALRAHAVHEMPVLLLAPEFLLPALALFKAVLRQLSARHLVDGPQRPPHAFMGVALLLQMCQNVNVYGFDPPELVRAPHKPTALASGLRHPPKARVTFATPPTAGTAFYGEAVSLL